MDNYKNLKYKDLEDISIFEIKMSARTRNCLIRRGVKNFAQVITMTDDELRKIRNMGEKSIKEVYSIISSFNNEEITPNMKILDAHTIGMNREEKKEYTSKFYDRLLKMELTEIGLDDYSLEEFKRIGINNIKKLVLCNENILKKKISYYHIYKAECLLSKFGLHFGMTRDELDNLTRREENISKKDVYNIEGIISYLIEQNNYLKEENEADKIILNYLQRLHKDYLGVEKLDDSEKQKIIELYDFVKENIVLKEENKKQKEDINSYMNNFEKASYIRDEKIKQKRKVKEDK